MSTSARMVSRSARAEEALKLRPQPFGLRPQHRFALVHPCEHLARHKYRALTFLGGAVTPLGGLQVAARELPRGREDFQRPVRQIKIEPERAHLFKQAAALDLEARLLARQLLLGAARA